MDNDKNKLTSNQTEVNGQRELPKLHIFQLRKSWVNQRLLHKVPVSLLPNGVLDQTQRIFLFSSNGRKGKWNAWEHMEKYSY